MLERSLPRQVEALNLTGPRAREHCGVRRASESDGGAGCLNAGDRMDLALHDWDVRGSWLCGIDGADC